MDSSISEYLRKLSEPRPSDNINVTVPAHEWQKWT